MTPANGGVDVKREEYVVSEGASFPEAMTGSVFIPGIGAEGVHYCFLVDVGRRRVTCWTIDVRDAIERMTGHLGESDLSAVPWRQETLRKFVEVVHFPHSVERWGDWLYLSLIEGGFIIALHAFKDEFRVLYDEHAAPFMMYSSTNQIRDGKIYFTRWNATDTLRHEQNRGYPVNLELGVYDIAAGVFTRLGTLAGPDDIHYTAVSGDGKQLVIVEMSQDPVAPTPIDREFEELSSDEKRQILDGGVHLSDLITYDIDTGNVNRLQVAGGPAHVEWDDEEPVYYLSSHCLVTNNNTLYAFGHCRIDRFRLQDGLSILERSYEAPDLLRGPSHRLLSLAGQRLMIIPVYPNQLHIVNRNTMTLAKKVVLGRQAGAAPTFDEGPVRYPPSSQEKTPYTVDVQPGTPLLYLSRVWDITGYDFEAERKTGTIVYNREKPMMMMGHASTFQMGAAQNAAR